MRRQNGYRGNNNKKNYASGRHNQASASGPRNNTAWNNQTSTSGPSSYTSTSGPSNNTSWENQTLASGPRNNTAWSNRTTRYNKKSKKPYHNRNSYASYRNYYTSGYGNIGYWTSNANESDNNCRKRPSEEKLSAMSDEDFARLNDKIERWEKLSSISSLNILLKIGEELLEFVNKNSYVQWKDYEGTISWLTRLRKTPALSSHKIKLINEYASKLQVYNAILQTPLPEDIVFRMINCITHIDEVLRLDNEFFFIEKHLGESVFPLFPKEKVKREERLMKLKEQRLKEKKERYVIECIDYLLEHRPDGDITKWRDDIIISEAHIDHYKKVCKHKINWEREYSFGFLNPDSFQENPEDVTTNEKEADDENFEEVFLGCFDTVMDWAICAPSDAFKMKGLFDIHADECVCQLKKTKLYWE